MEKSKPASNHTRTQKTHLQGKTSHAGLARTSGTGGACCRGKKILGGHVRGEAGLRGHDVLAKGVQQEGFGP